ncbi:MAG TPA: zinc ribbon domain-containing protein [Blastocatellia bacterium]|nr:zinc ribbon domain-containing protein [Blastocatellia bacterium]
MFCPKCGVEPTEVQKFCKNCGTNLQAVNEALQDGGQTNDIFGIDMNSIKRSADSIKSWSQTNWGDKDETAEARRTTRKIREQEREIRRRYPRPKEWMSYSWQHNLKNGLLSLFSGVGFAYLFYYLGHPPVSDEIIQAIREASHHDLPALPTIFSLVWLLPLVSALKGIAQIIYAAFFAESMATLAERFTPPLKLEAPKIEQELPVNNTADFSEPPPSVTEHTTKIFEEAQPDRG